MILLFKFFKQKMKLKTRHKQDILKTKHIYLNTKFYSSWDGVAIYYANLDDIVPIKIIWLWIVVNLCMYNN